uniref:odorant receptor 131-2-like n=1 Tax=Semicossyphus pulcher TaxID=241346 RepID=UPI0037E81D34
MNDSSQVTQVKLFPIPAKAVLFMLPCLFFLYVNGVMMFALLRKPFLLESSRYILFGHLLLTDSLQLVITILMYMFAVTMLRMISFVCVVFTLLGAVSVKMSPLNLAVMSLERYVAICFPLRHAEITTTRRTCVAIALMWVVGSFDSVTQLFLFFSLENTSFPIPTFCNRQNVLKLQIYSTLNKAFIILYFVSVSIIIIFTYIAIMITVKTASSNAHKASKAHKTVLLHLIQLCLCLMSTLFSTLNSNKLWDVHPALALQIQYVLFVCLIVFPKCLSPLIYGLRDHTFRHIFKHYFTFGCRSTCQ